MKTFLYILLAIVILLFMVVIHELGHYIAGKILKFKINEFSVGFGPKLFSKKKKNGEVISLRVLPLGGYCAFEGESGLMEDAGREKQTSEYETPQTAEKTDAEMTDDSLEQPANNLEDAFFETPAVLAEPKARTFLEEKPWKRIIVLLAGGTANLISAVIFSLIFIWAIGYTVPTVSMAYLDANGGVYNALQKNDKILAVDGEEITIMKSYEDMIKDKAVGDSISVTVMRGEQYIDINITKQHIVSSYIDDDGNEQTVDYEGFGFMSSRVYEKVGFGYALKYCVPYTFKLAWLVLKTFGQLIVGQIRITELAGPVGTVSFIADLAHTNWRNILILLPFIASNLGVFNLLPIPALDGSKVVFTAVEWIRKKPINQKVENMIHSVGLILLLGLVVILDIIRFFT